MNIDSFNSESLNMVQFCQVVDLFYILYVLYIVSPSFIFVLYSVFCDSGLILLYVYIQCTSTVLCVHLFYLKLPVNTYKAKCSWSQFNS